MRDVWGGWRVVVLGLVAAAPIAAWSRAQPEVTGYAVLGLDAASIGPHARIETGNVGVNRGTAFLGRGARVAGSVAADIVRLARNVRLGGLSCRILEGRQTATGCGVLTSPLVDSDQLTLVQALAGGAEVSVPPRASTAPLAPGAYGALVVGRHGLLLLGPGNYDVRSITLAPHGNLLCTGRCRIRVQEGVLLKRGARLGPTAPATTPDVRVEIEGSGPATAFRTQPRAQVMGTVYAPRGEVVLGGRGHYQGVFVAATVRVERGARVQAVGGF